MTCYLSLNPCALHPTSFSPIQPLIQVFFLPGSLSQSIWPANLGSPPQVLVRYVFLPLFFLPSFLVIFVVQTRPPPSLQFFALSWCSLQQADCQFTHSPSLSLTVTLLTQPVPAFSPLPTVPPQSFFPTQLCNSVFLNPRSTCHLTSLHCHNLTAFSPSWLGFCYLCIWKKWLPLLCLCYLGASKWEGVSLKIQKRHALIFSSSSVSLCIRYKNCESMTTVSVSVKMVYIRSGLYW